MKIKNNLVDVNHSCKLEELEPFTLFIFEECSEDLIMLLDEPNVTKGSLNVLVLKHNEERLILRNEKVNPVKVSISIDDYVINEVKNEIID